MRLFEGTPFDRPPRCERCGELEEQCTCPPPEPMRLPPGEQTARIAVEKRKRGKRVTVVSTLTTSTPMISDDLRRQADFFMDVADLAKTVGRPQVQRPVEA